MENKVFLIFLPVILSILLVLLVFKNTNPYYNADRKDNFFSRLLPEKDNRNTPKNSDWFDNFFGNFSRTVYCILGAFFSLVSIFALLIFLIRYLSIKPIISFFVVAFCIFIYLIFLLFSIFPVVFNTISDAIN